MQLARGAGVDALVVAKGLRVLLPLTSEQVLELTDAAAAAGESGGGAWKKAEDEIDPSRTDSFERWLQDQNLPGELTEAMRETLYEHYLQTVEMRKRGMSSVFEDGRGGDEQRTFRALRGGKVPVVRRRR